MGPIETCNSDTNHVVLHAQNDRSGLCPMETSNTDAKSLLWMHKTTDEGWD